jgi:hypothetical protein
MDPKGSRIVGVARPPRGADEDVLFVRASLYFHEGDEPDVHQYGEIAIELHDGRRASVVIDADTHLRSRRHATTVARARADLPFLAPSLEGRPDDASVTVRGAWIRDGDPVDVLVAHAGGAVRADAVGVGAHASRELDALTALDDRRWLAAAAALAIVGAAQIAIVLVSGGARSFGMLHPLGVGLGLSLLVGACFCWWYAAGSPGFHGSPSVLALIAALSFPTLAWLGVTPAAVPVVALWFHRSTARDAAALRRLRRGPVVRGELTHYDGSAVKFAAPDRGEIVVPIDPALGNVGMAGAMLPLENWVRRGEVLAVLEEDREGADGHPFRSAHGQRVSAALIVPPGKAVDVRAWLRRRTLVVAALWLLGAVAVGYLAAALS